MSANLDEFRQKLADFQEAVKRGEVRMPSESRVLEIGREELAKARESYQPGGNAKPGTMFQEKGR